VDLVVVHAISLPPGVFGSGHVIDFFMGRLDEAGHPAYAELKGTRVSAHFFVERGGQIHQFVDTEDTAWHAGKSRYRGRTSCNDFSIGIELEGDGSHPFTRKQYDRLGMLCAAVMDHYPGVTAHRVVGHSDVAPGRKWDPGPTFDWKRARSELDLVRKKKP
jgi:AmpD protein